MRVYKEIYGGSVSGIMNSPYYEDTNKTHMTATESQEFVKQNWPEMSGDTLREVLKVLRKGEGVVELFTSSFTGRTHKLIVKRD